MSTYDLDDGIANIRLDEGKANALATPVIEYLDAQLDRALDDGAASVVLWGREGMLSAGFDLAEVRAGRAAQENLRRLLIDLLLRLFTFERPIVIACTGHALAAGAALLLAADRRIGLDGPFKLGFNEASLGVPISAATVELARYRMPMPWFESLVSGTTFPPDTAAQAGLLDRVTPDPTALQAEVRAATELLAGVPATVFSEMRLRARGATAAIVRNERRRLGAPD